MGRGQYRGTLTVVGRKESMIAGELLVVKLIVQE